MPDIESVVKISRLFQISLDELLVKKGKRLEEQKTQITSEDMARINLHNRRMNLLLTSGILFLTIGVMMAVLILAVTGCERAKVKRTQTIMGRLLSV